MHITQLLSTTVWNWLLPGICGFLIAVCLTHLLIRIAPKRGWVSMPRQDRWNVRVVAHFGGLPILLACSITASLFFRSPQTWVLLLLTWGMALAGLTDDFLGLNPGTKLVTQFVMASLAVWAGILHPLTAHFWFNAVFTVLWIVGITNAVNLLDNIDGLAAGISVIASAQVILLAGPGNPISGLALCMLAASAGFLIFNANPAKIFMGDVGALSIGFFLACASVKAAEHLSSLGSVLLVPTLVMFIPVFDTLLVSFTRRLNGRRIFLGARDHTSHRLVMIGLNERQSVWLLYGIAITAGIMAFLWKTSWGSLGAGLVGLFLIGSTLFWIYLAKLQLPASWMSAESPDILLIPHFAQKVAFSVSVILLDAAVICVGLYLGFIFKFEKLDQALLGRFLFAVALFLAVKLPLLVVFGVYEGSWSITQRRQAYPVLQSMMLAACVLTAIAVSLPPSKIISSSVILFDTVATTALLVLCRFSGRIFDDLLGTTNVLNQTVKRIVTWASIRPFERRARDGQAEEDLRIDETPEVREHENRPN